MTEQYTQPSINSPRGVRTFTVDDAISLDVTLAILVGAITLTLPDARTVTGVTICIKSPGGTGSLATVGGQTIDGGVGFNFTVVNQSLCLQSDGSDWTIVANVTTTGGAVDLQNAYDNGATGIIVLSGANGPVRVRDAAVPLGTNLFVVQDNGGGTPYLGVDATGIAVAGGGSFTGAATSSNIKRGSGNPNGSVTGSFGDVFQRTDAGSLVYVNTDGAMGWVQFATGAPVAPQDLNNVLGVGNTTGGVNIVITDGDIIRGEDAAGAAGSVTVRGGNDSGGGPGGQLTLQGGNGDDGGGVSIVSGVGNVGPGGDISITASNGAASNGGSVFISSGTAPGGQGGDIDLTAGAGDPAGRISLNSGSTNVAIGNGADIRLITGDGAGAGSTSGNVRIFPGASPAGSPGAVYLERPASGGDTTELRFVEDDPAENYIALKAPASVPGDLAFSLPATDGALGDALSTDGAGAMSFRTPAGGPPIFYCLGDSAAGPATESLIPGGGFGGSPAIPSIAAPTIPIMLPRGGLIVGLGIVHVSPAAGDTYTYDVRVGGVPVLSLPLATSAPSGSIVPGAPIVVPPGGLVSVTLTCVTGAGTVTNTIASVAII